MPGSQIQIPRVHASVVVPTRKFDVEAEVLLLVVVVVVMVVESELTIRLSRNDFPVR
jgi:hypothetical protein